MNTNSPILLAPIEFDKTPFPHFISTETLEKDTAGSLFNWFERTNEWILAETDFYNQHELNLLNTTLPVSLRSLVSDGTISWIKNIYKSTFRCADLDLVGVTAHKLVDGQKIGIHNDFINGEETHRLVVHINPSWADSNGGYLMLFNSEDEGNLAKVLAPLNNFGFGFEISKLSHHAVSKVFDFSRYTLIYTFKAA